MSVVCYQVEVSATVRLLVQRSPTECDVSVCDHEASKIRRPWPTGGLLRHGGECRESISLWNPRCRPGHQAMYGLFPVV